jgi:pimeloyl-ACP methyl ester carboxylesterase
MTITGVAADVPYTALPPAEPSPDAPLVVSWHLMDPPRTDAAMAAALPMQALPAWRVYFGLPMFGRRALPGGAAEFFELAAADAVLNVFEPVLSQAAAEAVGAIEAVRAELGIAAGPLGVLGGSAGALVAAEVTATAGLPVAALALVSPAIRLRSVVAANEHDMGVSYEWSDAAEAAADRFDFLRRWRELAAAAPATAIVVGDQDYEGFVGDAAVLSNELGAHYPDPEQSLLVEIPGMGHALAEEPGVEPAAQTEHAKEVDSTLTEWFREHLAGSRRD